MVEKRTAEETTMFGKLLNRVQTARKMSRISAVNELWHRNGLAKPGDRVGYKLAETVAMHHDGTEITEYRLYKLIDATVTTVSSEVSTRVETGLETLVENKSGAKTSNEDS